MALELFAFALVGLAVGGAAVLALPALFPAPRPVTVLTGVCSALLTGSVGHAILGPGHQLATVPISAVGACLLISLLARPDQRSSPAHAAHAARHRRPHHA
ncbi:hypothetical protein [Streptacidiphilus sp. EB129]|uniref:hypothetical protein n=1 Tax=Streptacidiphilus sp. EB129 TaxID=3156262 RepID=UPI003510F6E0